MKDSETQTILIAEHREPSTNTLDDRQVLILTRDTPLFATFWPNGTVELLQVTIATGRADSHYFPGSAMKKLVEAYLDYQADIMEQKAHAAFVKAQKATEAQVPLTLEEQYQTGLLAIGEYERLTKEALENQATVEAAHNAERPPCAEEGCQEEANYHYNGGHYCWQHRPEPKPEPVPTVQKLPGGAMIFADPQSKMPF